MSKNKQRGSRTKAQQADLPKPKTGQWLIEPRDPLIVRDGRPFNNTPGARAYTQLFPPPSVLAGVIRTQAGKNDRGEFNPAKIDLVKQIKIYGPLLFKLPNPNKEKDEPEFLCPAPADALLFEAESTTEAKASDDQSAETTASVPWLRRLVPIQAPAEFVSDFNELGLVGLVEPDPRKPTKEQPQFWYWKHFLQWLHDPEGLIDQTQPSAVQKSTDLGIQGLPIDQRTHVQIDSESQSAEDGRLFQTRGLSFTQTTEQQLTQTQRLALFVKADYNQTNLAVPPIKLAPLGGERRLAHWHNVPATTVSPYDQATIDVIAKKIGQTKACRVILLTPAMFEKGYRPTWLCCEVDGVQPKLAAIAIKRAQVISGWDLAARGAKPTRRLAPAGTVFFLSLVGEKPAIEAWVRHHWMSCVSDADQDRRDGFGLAVLGAWDGKFAEIKEQSHES